MTAHARLVGRGGNKARAARYFNVARELLKEQKREEADLIASERVALRGGSGVCGRRRKRRRRRGESPP